MENILGVSALAGVMSGRHESGRVWSVGSEGTIGI